MTRAADVIAAVNQRRLLKQGRIETPGQMPSGWQQWFDAMPRVDAQVARTRVDGWIAPLVQGLTYPQAKSVRLALPFFHLQRLTRPDDPREERGLRVGVGVLDILLHILLAGLLLWLMYLRFMAMAQSAAETGTVVQVEFIGRGNAQAGGGADAAMALPVPAPAMPRRASAATPAATSVAKVEEAAAMPTLEQVATPVEPAMAASREVPELVQMPPPQARQVLQVSEVPQPQPGDFKLPPPRTGSVALPQATLRDVQPQQQVQQVEQFEAKPLPQLQAAQRQVALREVQPQQQVRQIERFEAKPLPGLQVQQPAQVKLQAPEVQEQVRALEVFTPDAQLLARERAVPAAIPQATLRDSQLAAQVQALPLRSPAAAAAEPADVQKPVVQKPVAAANGKNAQVQAESGHGVAASGKDAGPRTAPASGGWPSAAKSDDWGAARRNVAGTGSERGKSGNGKAGLFDADGSVRLPDAWTQEGGLDLDRAGTWLKRPGLEYRGTRFDKYWIPQGTLLEEWVRRGIKQLSIPIPGTGLKLQCVISLLQFGGGCMPVNPDANEQPSSGRKAPDIPFKPELQEDNGSVRPAAATPSAPVPPGG